MTFGTQLSQATQRYAGSKLPSYAMIRSGSRILRVTAAKISA
jgi:hypothetical protein